MAGDRPHPAGSVNVMLVGAWRAPDWITLAGTILGVIGLAVALITWRRPRSPKLELTWQTTSTTTRLPPVDGLAVTFHGEQVAQITVTEVTVANTGRVPLTPTNFTHPDRPIRVRIGTDTVGDAATGELDEPAGSAPVMAIIGIVGKRITEKEAPLLKVIGFTAPPDAEVRVTPLTNGANVVFQVLEPREELRLVLMHRADDEDVDVGTHVIGGKVRRVEQVATLATATPVMVTTLMKAAVSTATIGLLLTTGSMTSVVSDAARAVIRLFSR